MKVILTEETIRKALHESIDEMILEEELLQEWGESFKKALNGVKNAAAMYMDWRTNGQWNNKYGIYANGTGKTTEMYYLNKWFNTHLKNIKQIEYRNNTPSADFSKSREYVERNGEKVYTDTEIQEKDIQTYVLKNITPANFNNWVKNYIQDRQALKLIDDYILKCQSQITDVRSAMNYLNTMAFLSDKSTGQLYIQTKQGELGGQRQQYQNQNDKKNTINLFNYLYNNSKKITKQMLSQNIDSLNKNFGISDSNYQLVKKYILDKLQMMNDNDAIFKRLQYFKASNFMKMYGNYYR
jgi:hypothetical protein